MRYHNEEEYSEKELEDCFNVIKKYSIEKRIEALKLEQSKTLDINKKIEISQKIENINKEVLKW